MANAGRRWLVGFDPEHFRKKAEAGLVRSSVEVFREAFRSNLWNGASRSGPGSTLAQTARITSAIPRLCERLEVRCLLDVPSGDFSWVAAVDMPSVSYVGGDLVPEIVKRNRDLHAAPNRTFLELDLTKSELPPSDLVLCRDCLVHLSNADAMAALKNVARSDGRWFLATTFPAERENVDIVTGDWRPIDLTKSPFDLPQPIELLNEGCTEQDGAFSDKSLGLWAVSELRRSMAGVHAWP